MDDFGATLRRLRRKAGLTMGALARALGCSVPIISSIERGDSGVAPSDITRIAAALGCEPDELFNALPGGLGREHVSVTPASPHDLGRRCCNACNPEKTTDDTIKVEISFSGPTIVAMLCKRHARELANKLIEEAGDE